MSATVVVDVTITICMTIILYHTRTGASSEETYDRISHLLRLTIQTGFLTSALAIIVIPWSPTENNVFTIPFYLLGKTYVITLLANLNARTARPAPDPSKPVKRPVLKRPDSSGGILSFLHSVVHTMRNDLNSAPNVEFSGENISIDETGSQSQTVNHEEGAGSIREEDMPRLDELEHLT